MLSVTSPITINKGFLAVRTSLRKPTLALSCSKALCGLVFCLFFNSVLANQITYQFALEPDAAGIVVKNIATQTDTLVLFPTKELHSIRSHAVNGEYTTLQALQIALQGTGLTVKQLKSGAITIRLSKRQEQNRKGLLGFLSGLFSNNKEIEQTSDRQVRYEEVIVEGVRDSLVQALNRKRYSSHIIDSISAEDIGQFPDTNVAETLQRINGIQMARNVNTGEGTSVQIRGLSDNNIEINGEVFVGPGGENRDINLQNIPSEMFSAIVVNKTASADKVEGANGGSVSLIKQAPLQMKKDVFGVLTMKGNYTDTIGDIDKEFFGSYGRKYNTAIGEIGCSVSVGIKNVNTRSEQLDTTWQQMNSSGLGGKRTAATPNYQIDINGDGVTDINDRYFVPKSFTLKVDETLSERNSFGASVQWRPASNTDILLDVNYFLNETIWHQGIVNIPTNDRAHTGEDNSKNYTVTGNVLTKGRLENIVARVGAAPGEGIRDNTTLTWFLSANHQINSWRYSATINSSRGKQDEKRGQINYGYDWDNDGQFNANDFQMALEWDYANSASVPNLVVYGPDQNVLDFNRIDHPNMRVFQANRIMRSRDNQSDSLKIDIEKILNHSFFENIKVGYRFSDTHFSQKFWEHVYQARYERNNVVVNRFGARVPVTHPSGEQCITESPFGEILTDYKGDLFPKEWATSRCGFDTITQLYRLHPIDSLRANGVPRYGNQNNGYAISETTDALYLTTDFSGYVGKVDFFGNIGGRYVHTDTISAGHFTENIFNDKDACIESGGMDSVSCAIQSRKNTPVKFKGGYSNFLPSLSLNIAVTPSMYLRFGASKTISRPSLFAIRPAVAVNFIDQTLSRGNPGLKPLESNNWDVSYEWYFNDESVFAVALFGKSVKNVISTIEVSDYLFSPEQGGDGRLYTLTTKANDDGRSVILGHELTFQHTFSYLPSIFKYTGIHLNYTHIDEDSASSSRLNLAGSPLPRNRLSENSFNITGFYDDGKFSARLSYNWRDEMLVNTVAVTDRYMQCDKDGNGVVGNNDNGEWGCDIGKFPLNAPVDPLAYQQGVQPRYAARIREARGQLDLSLAYKITPALKLTFSGVNLNESAVEEYLDTPVMPVKLSSYGARYTAGLSYKF